MHHLSPSRSPDLPGWCAATLVAGCALPQSNGRITPSATTNSARKATHSYQGQGYGCLNTTAIREQDDVEYLSRAPPLDTQPSAP